MSDIFYEIIERSKIFDNRGYFLKIMNGYEAHLDKNFGEIYVVMGRDGQLRANHYHLKATEWFSILYGEVNLGLKNLKTGQEVNILLSDKTPVTVRVSPNVAHTLLGFKGVDYVVLAYSNLKYDPADTIHYNLM